MIGHEKKTTLWSALVRWLGGGGTWLSTEKPSCVLCKLSVTGERKPLGLCSACYRSIPWIKDVLCPVCGRGESCQDCKRRGTTPFVRSRSAVRYDETMKEWLALLKYRGDERLLPLFGGMLVHAFHQLKQAEADLDAAPAHSNKKRSRLVGKAPFDWITFVPVSTERLKERGFNQAEEMARELASHLKLPVLSLLIRTRHTDKQSFKNRSQRIQDLGGVFAFDDSVLNRINRLETRTLPLRILLVDDVYTTGSTLTECSRVIAKRLPAEIYGLTWAR